jgi:hypothetical protein
MAKKRMVTVTAATVQRVLVLGTGGVRLAELAGPVEYIRWGRQVVLLYREKESTDPGTAAGVRNLLRQLEGGVVVIPSRPRCEASPGANENSSLPLESKGDDHG